MEFTATSYKLEVGHPPGAPFFMMVMRLFTMLSFGNPEWVGFASNLMSCVASAFCILFMFWTITRLAAKMYGDGFDKSNKTHTWTALGAGVTGAMSYAFSDTFWFSAVESEVYALSSMFTALVVWLMMRWEEVADEPHSTRWLILIAYMMGLSIGVHILNLLTIPALVFIYYFRKTPQVTWKGVALALLAAGGILVAIYKMIMPWTVNVGAWFDRVFVNSLGLPVNSGLVVWTLVLFALVGLGVWFTHNRGKVLWNTILLCVGVILIGYSSYASVVIRSSVNPPMNSNRPDNAYSLLGLLGREQFGSYPLLYGPSYTSPVVDYKYKNTWYMGEDGKYKKNRVLSDYVFAPGTETLFPRMWDNVNPASKAGYEAWMGNVKMRTVRIPGTTETAKVPTLGQHFRYFFSYQLNYMYWRYFMWNFVGRQNDVQGRGDILNGNWLSGINAIDNLYLGPQNRYITDRESGDRLEFLPEEVRRNPGRNKFFFLPFLLGILGLIAQVGKDRRGFAIVMWLFAMMGVVLAFYFNSNIPFAVRERDYAFAGSFYAFGIWIGLGGLWIQEIVAKAFRRRECWVSAVVATAVCAVVPGLLAAQGWDDHDRSGRYIGHDYGHNFLVSTLPNSIIMNYGDNDTFPLWYNQEVENLRTDVRIMNMSYIGADWYIEQMLHAYNESAPVPLSIPMAAYRDNQVTYVEELLDRPMTVREAVDWVASRNPQTRYEYEPGRWLDYIPTRRLVIPVNKANALASGIVKPQDAHLMVDSIEFTLPEGAIEKPQLVLLDLLANFDWSRPLYFTYAQLVREIGLGDWLQADGWAFRLVPIRTPYDTFDAGRIDTELDYDLLMNRYKYGRAGAPGVYVDWHSVVNLQFARNYNAFVRLAEALIAEGDNARAVEVLDRALKEYPFSKFNYDDMMLSAYSIISAYYAAGATERADVLLEDYANTLQQYIEYYITFDGAKAQMVSEEWTTKVRNLDALSRLAALFGRQEQYEAIDSYLDSFGPAEEPPAELPADTLPVE
jgi:tetratricopeptide (TPR) repeat protein